MRKALKISKTGSETLRKMLQLMWRKCCWETSVNLMRNDRCVINFIHPLNFSKYPVWDLTVPCSWSLKQLSCQVVLNIHQFEFVQWTILCNSLCMQVSKERGEALAIEYGIKFMETSAKASINVEEAFYTLARDIKAKTEKKLVRNCQYSTVPLSSLIPSCSDVISKGRPYTFLC